MKILHLTLKKKWFDMILSGEKKEEYRAPKAYWLLRLIEIHAPKESPDDHKYIPDNIEFDALRHPLADVLKAYYSKFKTFDAVEFKNGYAKDAPTMLVECKGIRPGLPAPKWSDGAKGEHIVISLGDIISTSHLSHE